MTTAHRGLIGIAGLFWALQGCFDPSPPAGVLCAPDGWCPDGQSCDPFTWMCVAGTTPDAGTPWNDSGWPWLPDAAPWNDGGLRTGIGEALISYGPVDIQIPEVLVTYVKPAATFEPAGFFVQSEQYGPALFVGVDPDLGGTRLQVGDRVSFRIFEMLDIDGLPMASYIDDVVIHGRDESVDPLIQDITYISDITFNLDLYAAELVTSTFRIDGNFSSDDSGLVSFQISTNGVLGYPFFRLRLPDTLHDLARLESDCVLEVATTPVWRYYEGLHLLAYELSDFRNVDCPVPDIEAVTVESGTVLRIELSRAVDPATLAPDGSQFAFDGGLTATSATASGRVLTITTTEQVDGQSYALTIDPSLHDVFGKGRPPDNVIFFSGVRSRARVRINEVKANIEPGCDLVELRVVEPGSLSGFDLRVQNSLVLTFASDLTLERNDLVVVHFDSSDGSCRRSGSSNETQAANEQPRSVYPANFDTAYDWYTPNAGPADGPSVLAVRDDEDRILDAILLTDGLMQDTSSLTENAAALVVSAGQWQSQSGGVPAGGFVDAAFHDSAAPGIKVDPANVTGGFGALDGLSSVQRSGNADTDRRGDWATAVHTFGVANAGQSPL
jgi:hypothetical protein